MSTTVVAIAAIIATSNVSYDSPKSMVLEGGDRALVATEKCIEDGRDISKSFLLEFDDKEGRFEVNCQILESATGDYYAAKGFYRPYSETLKTLIELFNKQSAVRGE